MQLQNLNWLNKQERHDAKKQINGEQLYYYCIPSFHVLLLTFLTLLLTFKIVTMINQMNILMTKYFFLRKYVVVIVLCCSSYNKFDLS